MAILLAAYLAGLEAKHVLFASFTYAFQEVGNILSSNLQFGCPSLHDYGLPNGVQMHRVQIELCLEFCKMGQVPAQISGGLSRH